MARFLLSEGRIKALDKAGIYADGDGLYMRVRKTGSRQWLFIYRRGDQRTEIGLGGYGQGTAPVSLKLAREKAETIRQQLARGVDPRPGRATVMTFREAVADTLAVKDVALKNEKSRWQWHDSLERLAADLHDRPIAGIGVDDLVKVLKPIWTTTPEVADRLRMRIGAVIDHARARGLFKGDNPANWGGGLKHLLPPRLKLQQGHHTAAAYADIPTAMEKLRAATGTAARAVEFQTLTAARAGEVRYARWEEINLKAGLWVCPAVRMKMKRDHTVPLVARAVEILHDQHAVATGPLVFGGDRDHQPISDTAMVKALRRATGDKATLHGLRSTFRDWAGDKTEFPREVAEAALAHLVGDEVERAYRRGDALEKRRKLMTAWADYCSGSSLHDARC